MEKIVPPFFMSGCPRVPRSSYHPTTPSCLIYHPPRHQLSSHHAILPYLSARLCPQYQAKLDSPRFRHLSTWLDQELASTPSRKSWRKSRQQLSSHQYHQKVSPTTPAAIIPPRHLALSIGKTVPPVSSQIRLTEV